MKRWETFKVFCAFVLAFACAAGLGAMFALALFAELP